MPKPLKLFQPILASGVLALAVHVGPALAGTSTSSFQVGIRIGPPPAQKTTAPSRLRYTCGAAASVLSVAGYGNPVSLDCSGRSFAFRVTRNGKTATVSFNPATGKIIP